MRLSLSILVAGLSLMPLTGCHIPTWCGTTPSGLAGSRQLSQQGVGAMERGQQQEAESLLAKAVRSCPTDHDARRYYAETLWLRSARPEAVAQMEEACRLDPEDTGQRVRLAEMHLAMGHLAPARQNAELAIRQDPKLASAWAVRGRVMRAQGDLRQALADFHRSLGLVADDRQILFEVADIYQRLGQPERSLESLQSLADTYSPGEESPQVLCLLGRAYVGLGRYEDAVASFTAAVNRDRPTADVLCSLAEAQRLAKRPREAVVTLQQALAIEPGHAASLRLLDEIQVAERSGSVRR
jgi:tetratricopeptide (TPR) repeat protein